MEDDTFLPEKPETEKPSMFSYALGLSDWHLSKPEPITDPQEIFNISHDYFSECLHNLKTPTSTGLALKLSLTRKELLELKNKTHTPQGRALNMAVSIITDMVERQLVNSKAGQPGLIFWLKNIDDWVDKTEVVQSKKTMKDFLDELKRTKETGEQHTLQSPIVATQ